MSQPSFVQIHFLTSYPASLLNRDDVGFAKRIPFGGAVRTRVSSQCLKRHWRTFEGENSLGSIPDAQMSVRSRRTFEKCVFEPLRDKGIAEEVARAATDALMSALLGESAKAKKAKAEGASSLETNQITVLGQPELDYLVGEAAQLCADAPEPKKVAEEVKKHFTKDRKKNLEALRIGAGLDAALFGRMVTSDILARCDAALHVAHAFTVHEEATESDYFSAVDDLLRSGDDTELGSGHIGTAELTSGLFYGYVVVDVPLLVENLSQDRALAAEVTERMVHIVSKVSPGAKLGSTAPHAYAHLVIVEAGNAQPRTLANAFLTPVRERPDVLQNTYAAMSSYLGELDAMYGAVERRAVAIGPKETLGQVAPLVPNLVALAGWAGNLVRSDT
jgi:CRISPR system Cascade subunit CasC